MSGINANETIGMLVAQQPLRASVFDRLGIDFCCGGTATLAQACATRGISKEEATALLQESDALAQGGAETENWLDASLTELADHIQNTHHRYLKSELPRLEELAGKVARVHGEKEPRLIRVSEIFSAMRQEIEQHTAKEEMVLFPFIRKLDKGTELPRAPFGSVVNPVKCMESEHADAGDALFELRELTDQYGAPDHACASWRALLAGLAHLDQDLRTHIHKESTILFPGAIAREQALALEEVKL